MVKRRSNLAIVFLPLLALLGALALAPAARANSDVMPPSRVPAVYRNVGVSEHLNDQVPLNLRFFNEQSEIIKFGDLLRPNRPIILQMGYLNCKMLCDQISRSAIDAARKIDGLTIGKDYDFVFVSIDPTDTPDLAALKRTGYVDQYARPEAASSGFHVLVGQTGEIQKLADAVGYRFNAVEGGQFAHPAVLMVLTPDGHISRYLYGLNIAPQTLKLSLVEASQGQIGSSIDQVLLICLCYDPLTGKYSMAATKLMQISGLFTVIMLGSAVLFWNHRRKQAESPLP